MKLRIAVLALLLICRVAPLAAAEQAYDPALDPFAEEEAATRIADPLEPMNRGIFWFNDKVYFYFLKPIARGYRVVPEPARISVGNFFDNLKFPIRFVNNILQFKFARAGLELDRFVINSTAGLAGLFDPASHFPTLPKYPEDLGQTFGRYGAGHGFFLVLPVLGPSSLRDGIGTAGDGFLDPVYYAGMTTLEEVGVKGVNTVNSLSLDNDTYEQIKEDALDPYLFIRNAYAQRRKAQVEK